MSCPNNEATKLNTKKKESCKENCSFNFSYNPNSSCILTNKGEYLDIKTDGQNKVTFNNQEITLQSTRLYSPSLHTFNKVIYIKYPIFVVTNYYLQLSLY